VRAGVRQFLLLAAILSRAAAQTESSFEGTVTDATGAAIHNATVTVSEMRTGAVRRLLSDTRGAYLVTGLSPGSYGIRAEAQGFRTTDRRGLSLDAGVGARVDFQLEVGQVSESVIVLGSAPLISSSSGDWGSAVDKERLEGLPLNGRDMFELAALEPGASVPYTQQRTEAYGTALHMSVDGARPTENDYRIDGVYASDATGSAAASSFGRTLGIDALQEVRLAGTPFLAEYGRAAGGHFIAVSRSGTNDFHGSVFEFFRNSAMDARNFFDSPTEPIPVLKRNQFGGVLSGPVVRNRIFFLVDYETVRAVSATTSIATTIDTAARTGILPGGNVVPSAAAAPFLALYPLPNGALFGDGTGQFTAALTTRGPENYATGKLDYIRSERWHFNARYAFDEAASTVPDPFLLWNFISDSQSDFVQTGAQYISSATTVHEFRAGFSRVDNDYTASETGAIPAGLSFLPGQPLGAISVTGLTDLGGQTLRALPFRFVTNDYQTSWEVSHVAGRHALKAGAGFERLQFNPTNAQDENGYYAFTSLANLISGMPSTGQILLPGSSVERGWRQNLFYLYIEDEFHVSRRVSVSAGLRYEPYTTPTEVNGLVSALPDPLHDTSVSLGIGVYRNPSRKNFGPRLALAADVFGDGRTVFRAGAGIFYDMLSGTDLNSAESRMPPYYNRLSLTDPRFPYLNPAAAGTGLLTVDGSQYYANQPYAMQWQAALERQLGRTVLLRAGYAANRGVHLPGYVADLNVPVPSYLPDGQIYFSPSAPLLNPAFSRIGMRLTQFPSTSNESSNPNYKELLNDDYMPFPLDFGNNRGRASFDLRQVLAADWSWETRRLTGWQFFSIVQAQTGPGFSPVIGFDRAGLRDNVSGDVGQRPNFVDAAPVVTGNPAQWFNPADFTLPPAGTYGNLGRNVIPGPGLVNIDFAVHKVLWRHENKTITWRTEIFNIANHPNFQIPSQLGMFNSNGTRIGSAGEITQTTTSSRQLQLALKAVF